MRKMLVLLLVVAASLSAEDSPLVALAKRTNRKASKTPVITNATVAASQGRMSMAAGDAAPVAQTSTPTALGAAPAAAAPAAKPAVVYAAPKTGAPAKVVTTPPISPTPYSPQFAQPQSTARNVEASMSARTIEPASGARNIEPTSSARNIEPASSARNVEPASSARNIDPYKPPK